MTHAEFRRLALARGLLPAVPQADAPEKDARAPDDGNASLPAAEAG